MLSKYVQLSNGRPRVLLFRSIQGVSTKIKTTTIDSRDNVVYILPRTLGNARL